MLPTTPTKHYLVWNRLQRITSFVKSFKIYKWLKKYYSIYFFFKSFKFSGYYKPNILICLRYYNS